jgi:hypothetical protein
MLTLAAMNGFYDDEEQSPYHDTAQVCLNGHVINDSYHTSPQFNKKFCDKCGEPTTTTCSICNEEIRGDYKAPGVFVFGEHAPPPNYCHNCGQSYPWTQRRLQTAKDLTDEFDELDEDDRAKLKASLDDLVTESPKTELAGTRFKKIAGKLGKESALAIKSVITDILSETAKKMLFP